MSAGACAFPWSLKSAGLYLSRSCLMLLLLPSFLEEQLMLIILVLHFPRHPIFSVCILNLLLPAYCFLCIPISLLRDRSASPLANYEEDQLGRIKVYLSLLLGLLFRSKKMVMTMSVSQSTVTVLFFHFGYFKS